MPMVGPMVGIDVVGIDKLQFGVADMKAARRFYTDWGLKKVKSTAAHALFRTVNGAEVELFPQKARHLPSPMEPGSTLRRLVWGVNAKTDLKAIAEEMAKDREVTIDPDGTVQCTDPMGLALAFRVTRRKRLDPQVIPMNTPDLIHRVDKRAIYYAGARPLTIGHVVFNAPDVKAQRKFYCERLGFHVTDHYRGRGVFLRAQLRGGHHNLFFLEDDKPGLNHIGFGVRDINELFGGGKQMQDKGWKVEIGPGRHRISSCYFWYFKSPLGAPNEYFCDEDFCTENWRPKVWDPHPDTFAEWLLAEGFTGKRPKPPTRTDKDMARAK